MFPRILSILFDQIYRILNKYDAVNVIPRSGRVSGLAYKGVGLAYNEAAYQHDTKKQVVMIQRSRSSAIQRSRSSAQYEEAGHQHDTEKRVMATNTMVQRSGSKSWV